MSDAAGALGGTLEVRLVPGFTPTNGEQFELLSFGSRTGVFSTIDGSGQTYTPSYTPTGVTLVVGAARGRDVAIVNLDAPDPVAREYVPQLFAHGHQQRAWHGDRRHGTDTLPPTVTFVSAIPSQGACSGATTIGAP